MILFERLSECLGDEVMLFGFVGERASSYKMALKCKGLPEFSGKASRMKEFLSLLSLAWDNRVYRRELEAREKQKLGGFTWYRSLKRAMTRTYRWKGPFALSRRARSKIELPKGDLIYGETPIATAYDLLLKVGVDQADHVVECGGGSSIFSLVAVSAFGCRVTTLEIVPDFVTKTREVTSFLGLERLRVRCHDILHDPIPEGTLYYLTGTTFSQESWSKLQRQMASAPVGAKAISLSVALDTKAWELIETLALPFSWGENTVHIHRRI